MRRAALFAALGAAGLACPIARAENASVSPYIDSLREEMKTEGKAPEPPREASNPDPYIQSIKQKLQNTGPIETGESYTEQVKKELGPSSGSAGYAEQEKARLGPGEPGGAIQAVKEGRSELHARRDGDIRSAAGLRIGASLTRSISAGDIQGASFESVYGTGYAPDVTLFYEYQPWHSEWFGNIGILASLGTGVYSGSGVFAVSLKAPDGSSFGPTSRVSTLFVSVPVVVGLDYRFNLFRVLRPFATVGPTLVGFYETRNDGGADHWASSRGLYAAGGISILMDWMSAGSSWDLYSEHGIKHYYLTVEYDRLSTFNGAVSYTVSGIFGGLTFEF